MLDLRAIITSRLEELDRNPFEAARIGGLERGFVNDILIGRKTSVRGNNLAKLAFALDWPIDRLVDGVHGSDDTFVIKIVGRIGAGSEILPEFEQVPPEGLFEIEVKVPVEAGAVAFEVEGDSMWPRYDPGDVIICGREGSSYEEIVGWEAAVMTEDGKRYLKQVKEGSKRGLFDLESYNARPIRDVKLAWAAQVDFIVPASKWRRLDRAAQKRLVEKTMKRSAR